MTDYKIIDMTNQSVLGLAEDKAICVPADGLAKGKASYLTLLSKDTGLQAEAPVAEVTQDLSGVTAQLAEQAVVSEPLPPMFASAAPEVIAPVAPSQQPEQEEIQLGSVDTIVPQGEAVIAPQPVSEPELVTPISQPEAPEAPTLFAPAEKNIPTFEPENIGVIAGQETAITANDDVPTAFVPLDLSTPYQPVEEKAPAEELPSDVASLTPQDKEELTNFLQEFEEAGRIRDDALKDKIIDFYCRVKLNKKEEEKGIAKVA